MSYTPHEWTTDETITAAKLNNIEEGVQEAAQGSGDTMFIITKDSGEGTLDKTWNEIKAAYDAGKMCVVRLDYDDGDGAEEHWQEVVTYIRGGINYVIMSVYSDQLGVVSGCGYEAATADGTLYQMGGD